MYLDHTGKDLVWCFCNHFDKTEIMPFTCIYDLFYTTLKHAILKKKKSLLQDWIEVAVFARIKEAGSRDDCQAGLTAVWNLLWLLGEWLLSAQHWVFLEADREVKVQGGCSDQGWLILRRVIGLGIPEVYAWPLYTHTHTHTHNPGYSSSSIWYVAGLPWHRTVCSKATHFKAAIC